MQLTIPFDTLTYAKRLRSVGFTEDQAETLAELQVWIIDDKLATKADLAATQAALELRLAELKTETIKWVAGMLLAQAVLIATLVKLL